ncbi:hypothetical protein ACWC5I_09875 [Kitasatospora sp. NPDC001574]
MTSSCAPRRSPPCGAWRNSWRSSAERAPRDVIDAGQLAAFVVDGPGRRAACAVATLTRSLPGPDYPGIFARAAVQFLLERLTERGCGLVTLNASDDGAPLYRALGFTPNERAMRLIQALPLT